jgi:hypothetical protein
MEKIAIDRIDLDDRRFCVSYPLSDELLRASVQQYSILSPCLLLDLPPLVVVTGFKRMEAARNLGLQEIPFLILQGGEREGLLTAINDNMMRGFNTVEKALCVDKMSSAGFSSDEIQAMMPLLGLQAHDKTLTLCQAVAASEEATKTFLLSHGITLNGAEQLFAFDADERVGIISLLSPHRLTVSHIREILQSLRLLTIREGSLLLDALSGAANVEELRRRLKRRINPLMTLHEEEWAKITHEAGFPSGMEVRLDPFFEKEEVHVCLKASSEEDVKGFAARLEGLVKDGYFRRIFELTRGLYRGN